MSDTAERVKKIVAKHLGVDESKVVETAMQELLRYYDQTALIEVPASGCIDLDKLEEDKGIRNLNDFASSKTQIGRWKSNC